jgi:hypothetical protein
MAGDDTYSVREVLLETLLEKVEHEQYPSATMLNMIEELLTPDDVPRYAEALRQRIASDNFPSIPMMARLKKFA